eukprot:m.1190509 g.1190509  ORF g.1190509 m.1190509 type:complete len:566 (-) comp24555_c1_seq20:2029-3726(-)
MADIVAAITGVPLEQATFLLEMAGGSADLAVSMYYENMGADSALPAPTSSSLEQGCTNTLPSTDTPHQHAVFGEKSPPPAWIEQGFEFEPVVGSGIGLLQKENGPCGVLAAVNAEVIAIKNRPFVGNNGNTTIVSDNELCTALARVLVRCSTKGDNGSYNVVVVQWENKDVGGSINADIVISGAGDTAHIVSVCDALVPHVAAFRGRGGVCLLCYSAVLTRGIHRVRADVSADGGDMPLVVGPFALCSTEMVSLLLHGVARGNVAAYSLDGTKATWRQTPDPASTTPDVAPVGRGGHIGMLSMAEVEAGRPLADELKSPTQPIFVLHGGDHFTVLWSPSEGTSEPGAAASSVLFHHWNGLPPNQRISTLRLAPCSLAPLAPTPPTHVQSQWRSALGEIESVVQARPGDKIVRPGCWKTHAYELALVTQAVVDEDNATAERPSHAPPPITLPQGPEPAEDEEWRCAKCYQTRFQTMCFGQNPAGTAVCQHCNTPRDRAGWTLWRQYEDLPRGVQRRIDRMAGPKLLTVLRTRWVDVDFTVVTEAGAEAVPGTLDFEAKHQAVLPSI